jgi:hypothetical protein
MDYQEIDRAFYALTALSLAMAAALAIGLWFM